MNRKTFERLYLVLIISVIVFMIFVVYYMINNKEAFTENPFIFGANGIGGEVSCSCTQKINDEEVYFAFNQTDFWNIGLGNYEFQNIDFQINESA